MPLRLSELLSFALAASPLACGGAPSPESSPIHAPFSGDWTGCYRSFERSGNPRGDLARLTRRCGREAGLRPVTRVLVRTQSELEPAHRFTFPVAASGSCYRIFAAGTKTIDDLDLLVRGPDGQELVADLTSDAFPVLPPRGPLCFAEPGLYMLEVSVFRGSGAYALQVWAL